MYFLHLLLLNSLKLKNNVINVLIYSAILQLFFIYQLILSATNSFLL
jgi:hypothetical protein